jgi:hypothetical protein
VGYGRVYSQEEHDFILQHYLGRDNQELTNMFNAHFGTDVKCSQIKSYKNNRKWDSGLTGHYEKGSIPANKGTKGLTSANRTSFKKGNRPANYRPVGSERLSKDGYLEVKIADPNKWRLKHLVIWEEANGPLPKGHCVIFLDSNKQNLALENLRLITRNQLARLNQNHLITDNADFTETGIIIADLYYKMSQRKKMAK